MLIQAEFSLSHPILALVILGLSQRSPYYFSCFVVNSGASSIAALGSWSRTAAIAINCQGHGVGKQSHGASNPKTRALGGLLVIARATNHFKVEVSLLLTCNFQLGQDDRQLGIMGS